MVRYFLSFVLFCLLGHDQLWCIHRPRLFMYKFEQVAKEALEIMNVIFVSVFVISCCWSGYLVKARLSDGI